MLTELCNFIQYSIDATIEDGSYGRLINHFKNDPNLKPVVKIIHEKPRIVFIALRDIAIGEELAYDYGDRRAQSIKSFPWLKHYNYIHIGPSITDCNQSDISSSSNTII